MAATRSLIPLAFLAATAALLLGAAPRAQAADPLVAAAGDISCDRLPTDSLTCQQQATSDLLVGRPLSAVLVLGDAVNENRSDLETFLKFYDPTWGRFKSITHPAIGNHEYDVVDAQGYFQYFGAAAGPPQTGYYSFDIGKWHLIALNSNCRRVGGCGRSSPQARWLRADLAAHPRTCTLAYWHHPHYTSGFAGDDDGTRNPTGAFWEALYQAGAEVVLGGHDHDYERFAPQTAEADIDRSYGLREFVVGTGGKSQGRFFELAPNSEVRNTGTFGVLELTLRRDSYSWRFVPAVGTPFTDRGSERCHEPPSRRLLRVGGPRKRLSRAGALSVVARCAAKCRTSARATITIGRRKVHSRRLTRTIEPLRRTRVTVRFARRHARLIRRASVLNGRLRAEVRVRANADDIKTDAARLRFGLRR